MDGKRSASFAVDEKQTENLSETPRDSAQTHGPNSTGYTPTSGDVVSDAQASDHLHRTSDRLPQEQQPGAIGALEAAQVINQQSEQAQQKEQDLGDVEQRRAMELLRSVDDDPDSGGQVIVCSAPDADSEKGNIGAVAPSAADPSREAQQQLAYRSLSYKGDSTTEVPAAVGSAVGPVVSGTTAPVDNVANLNADDSYIAQLTMKAQENEREDVLKVTNSTSSTTSR